MRPTTTLLPLLSLLFQRAAASHGSTLPLVFHVDPANPHHPAPQHYDLGAAMDAPNFGDHCTYRNTYTTCGSYLQLSHGVEHALFCSPKGVCAGVGSACGADESCGTDLQCNTLTHRCVPFGSFVLTASAMRQEQRRRAAALACPENSEPCSSGLGGFQCIFTNTDLSECGGCLNEGGQNCMEIPNAVSASCKEGGCVVHSCAPGFTPNDSEDACEQDFK